ncbi:Glycosyltransferase [Rhynchospora pubera]|uniref:Glycosyltransferase n=1 Tax=Rhynchospora pubera TaxID=906938 RepID=A0AAV8CZ84_9POAL|nr:Glycosyltransferase [Rhynchospora pubera]
MGSSTTISIPAYQSHVAVTPFPFGTHAPPLLSLTTALASLAPSSHFSFLCTNRSLASLPSPSVANLSFVPISDGLTGVTGPTNIVVEIGLFLKSSEKSLIEGLKAAELAAGCKVSCVMSDAFLAMACNVTREIGAKWVPVWTGGPQALSAHLHTDLIREIVGVGDEAMKAYGDKSIDFVPCLSHYRASDLQEGIIVGDLQSPFSTMLHQMAHRLPNSAAIVLNTFQGLDSTADSFFTQKFTNYFPAGPFHLLNSTGTEPLTDPYDCLPWLDQHEPSTVAYISLGTVVAIPPSELASLANGLATSGASFIWSLNEKTQSLLPPGFIDKINKTGQGKIVPWVPQISVLGHTAVGVFVSHCGWNSVMESIAAGVPILCRPFFGDQLVNARAISHIWKFGIALDEVVFTEQGVVRALEVLLKGEEGREMRDKVRQLKDMVNIALTQQGSSRDNLKRLMNIVCGC